MTTDNTPVLFTLNFGEKIYLILGI